MTVSVTLRFGHGPDFSYFSLYSRYVHISLTNEMIYRYSMK